MNEIVVYTDGGCSGNPGPGGWGIVVIADGVARQLSGGEAMTTNNKMELSAAIAALSVVKNTPAFAGRKVIVNIDSQYVKNGITQWKKENIQNYITADGQKHIATRVTFTPLTGRTHQLRLASANINGFHLPIIGDTLYGTRINGQRLLLHSMEISFLHPVTSKPMHFTSQPPF